MFTVSKIEITKAETSWPDIDADFGKNPITGKSKDDIINYLIDKYGADYVSSVGNRLVYSAKSILRDLATVYNIPASETFKMTKEYSDDMDVHGNIRRSKVVAEYFAKYPFLKDKVKSMAGVVSSLGIHAGGVLISDKSKGYSLYDYCALQRTKEDGRIASLWTKEEVAQLGFIKYDLLGLSAASIVHYARELLGLDPYDDAEEDEDVFRDVVMCLKHKNIFQFESQLGRQAFEDFLPTTIAETANASGIIRLVGAATGRAVYADYKMAVDYFQQGNTDWWKERLYDECVDEANTLASIQVLKDSYGVLIFQEQLSNLVKAFSKGKKTFTEGNHCRKLLDKHKKKYGTLDECQGDKEAIQVWHKTFMAILEEFFLPYLGRDGWDSPDQETQDFLHCNIRKDLTLPVPSRGPLKWIISAAAYLFNKLHAIAYSVNSYNMMWLKHYHPLEFWASALTCEIKDLDHIRNFMAAINLENPDIQILPPNVNQSESIFTIEGSNIRYGMGAINGMGASSEAILKEREKNGQYKSVADFVTRLVKTKVNKRAFYALMVVNAFEDFGTVTEVWKAFTKIGKDLEKPATDAAELATIEANLLGGNVTYTHPILSKAGYYVGLNELADGTNDTIALRILKVVKKTTKTGKPYNMLKVSCLNSGMIANIFDWQNRQDIPADYLIARISLKGNFYALLGPSTGSPIDKARAAAILRGKK